MSDPQPSAFDICLKSLRNSSTSALPATDLNLKAARELQEELSKWIAAGTASTSSVTEKRGRPRLRIGVIGSTRGTALQTVLDSIASGNLDAKVEIIISNISSAGILERAKKHHIKGVHISGKGKDKEDYDNEVSKALREHGVELVLLVGYMRILSKSFCSQWEGRVLNVHPSLLPDFAGGMDLAVHEAVLAAGKKESGCTVHFVTEVVDGGPIAVQKRCDVASDETPASLKAKVQALEGLSFVEAIEQFGEGAYDKICPAVHLPSSPNSKITLTYKDAGVDIDAGEALVDAIKPLCKSTRRKGCDADLGGFGGLFDLEAAGYSKDTVLVNCTDGVGTKLRVAQNAGLHDTVGIDLVAMCVNDLIVQGAEPLVFLDYFATGKLEVGTAHKVVQGIAEGCRQSMCGLIGGETAEMPQMYAPGDYDLAGFSVGAVHKDRLLPREIKSSQVLIGLPSSGVHSNGFSLVRKIIDTHSLSYDQLSPFGEKTSGISLGQALLEPTRIYVKQLMPLLKDGLVEGLAHITGGGLTENIPRVLPKNVTASIDLSTWDIPDVYKWLLSLVDLPPTEFLRTFNCGLGMVLIVEKKNANAVMESITAFEQANGGKYLPRLIGKIVTRGDGDAPVVYTGTLNL